MTLYFKSNLPYDIHSQMHPVLDGGYILINLMCVLTHTDV